MLYYSLNFTPQTRPAIPAPPETPLRPHHSRRTGLPRACRGQESPRPLECAESKIAPIPPLECSVPKRHHVKFSRMGSPEERKRKEISRCVLFSFKHLLLFLALTKCPPLNSFVLIFMHFDGGAYPPSPRFRFLQRSLLAVSDLLPFLPITDREQRSRARGLRLASFSSWSPLSCELTSVPQKCSKSISPTRQQSRITSHPE
jgi:hypothetical protein